jgi:peptidyl-prolyl cis-trans isomerase D
MMFDLITKHKMLAQIILAVIMVPFAFFGVDFYFNRASGPPSVAQVGDSHVTQTEFDEALREQQARARAALGSNYDPAMFDRPELRYALLEQLVNQHLLEQRARADHFRVTDARLAQFIAGLPAFQEDGRFSNTRYKEVLQSQNMTPAMFEDRVRAELALAPLQEPVVNAGLAAQSSVERFLGLLEQKREVAVATVDAAPFLKGITIDDARAKDYYEHNLAAFKVPEEVKFEYVVLSQQAMAAKITVDDAEARKVYEANKKQYVSPEERQASHILIAVKPDAPAAEKAAAKKKAEALLAQAKAHPDKFAELAKANSQDPGSAPQGGDLGTFTRGSMVKPFEDAVFSGKVGDIIGPVETDFGYHIIKITGETPSHTQSFDQVKASIEADIKRNRAAQKFAAAADQFQNLVYENADSLAPAAKALDLEVETSGLVSREQAQALAQGNAKFVDALFSPESVQARRNTEAIEVAPNTLMAGRVIEHKPSTPRPFETVKDEIKKTLAHNEAAAQAAKVGEAKIAALREGKDAGLSFAKPVAVGRGDVQQGLTPEALKLVFQADPTHLPSYAGAPNPQGGYAIYKVAKVIEPPPPDADKLKAARERVSQEVGRELMGAYLATLKANTKVTIDQAALEKK